MTRSSAPSPSRTCSRTARALPHDLAWSELSRRGTLSEQRLAALREATARKPEAPPGTRYAYANTGYVLAGAVLERAGGAPWEEQIEAKLFRPLA